MNGSTDKHRQPRAGLSSALRRSALCLVNHWLRRVFFDVPGITTSHLAAWLEDPNRSAPLLLDVRSGAEYETSFIDGAHWSDPTQDPNLVQALKIELAANPRAVVVYCSAGYRSARFARALLAAGVAPVYNLEGSIFAWANEGRALQNSRGPTTRVHPYNAVFGLLLDKHHRATRNEARS